MDNFRRLGQGAATMDQHFSNAPLADNVPVVLALLEIWYVNFWQTQSHAVLPYDQCLDKLPAFLQQLTMESNGKRVNHDGLVLDYASCPVVWGAVGTNGQHSFHQLLHQGTRFVPIDFIAPLSSHTTAADQHKQLFSNCLAQSRALLEGKNHQTIADEMRKKGASPEEIEQLAAHKVLPGNRPSTTICYEKTTPENLGSLIAMYEHKVFAASVIWQINPFDQWGVEFGKEVGQSIYSALNDGEKTQSFDGSTEQLLELFRVVNA